MGCFTISCDGFIGTEKASITVYKESMKAMLGFASPKTSIQPDLGRVVYKHQRLVNIYKAQAEQVSKQIIVLFYANPATV